MVSCAEFLGRGYFKTYSEFIFMLCVAKEYHRRGELMDFSMMEMENILGKVQKGMFRWCLYRGYVWVDGLEVESEPDFEEPYAFNMEVFGEYGGHIFCEEESAYVWDWTWVKQQDYGVYWGDILTYSKLGISLLHSVAWLVVGMKEGEKSAKKVVIKAEHGVAESTYIYINVLNIGRTIEWLQEIIDVQIHVVGKDVDVDFSLFINSGIMADRRKPWAIPDKHRQMEMEGITEGGIYIYYERKGVAESNIVGKITNASVVRLDKIDKTNVVFTIIPLYRTKEEIEGDFNSIPDDDKKSFDDMLNFKVNTREIKVDLYNMGIENYIFDEDAFIAKIDDYGTVEKLVTVNGKRAVLQMSQREAIYWLLRQYEVDFDRGKYLGMYPKEGGYIYDVYDCSYDDRALRVIRGTMIG